MAVMAFNPFNWFRKHQKVLFAGLIILTTGRTCNILADRPATRFSE